MAFNRNQKDQVVMVFESLMKALGFTQVPVEGNTVTTEDACKKGGKKKKGKKSKQLQVIHEISTRYDGCRIQGIHKIRPFDSLCNYDGTALFGYS